MLQDQENLAAAQAHFDAGDYVECSRALDLVLQHDPENQAALRLREKVAQIHSALTSAVALLRAGNLAACQAAIDTVFGLNPDDPRAKKLQGKLPPLVSEPPGSATESNDTAGAKVAGAAPATGEGLQSRGLSAAAKVGLVVAGLVVLAASAFIFTRGTPHRTSSNEPVASAAKDVSLANSAAPTKKQPTKKQPPPAAEQPQNGERPAQGVGKIASVKARGGAAKARPKRPRKRSARRSKYRSDDATLSLRSNPAGTLFVDGEEIGLTPVRRLSLSPGPHLIALEAPGHRRIERTVEVKRGERRTLVLRPVPLARPTKKGK